MAESKTLENNIDTDLKLFGSEGAIVEIIGLLSYIRNAINSQRPCEIKVVVGKRIESDYFDFTVGNESVPDYKAQPEISIN